MFQRAISGYRCILAFEMITLSSMRVNKRPVNILFSYSGNYSLLPQSVILIRWKPCSTVRYHSSLELHSSKESLQHDETRRNS